ncbi:MAG TPA: efflux RND transporter periplasmic adaptor subunit [Thermoanaerobaculia bacterium]|nr:efflux RND transporter periplasmic adaptor subunit [Thermoanaerobaculia bacterium]
MADKTSLDALKIERPDDGGRRRSWVWLILTAVLVVAAAAVSWWHSRAPEVEVVRVEAQSGSGAGAVLNASGYVTARRQATVSSKVTGKVTEVDIEEGMKVAAGQVVARLDDSTATKQLALAEAQLEASRSALTATEVDLKLARLDLQRTRNLAKQEISTQADLDAARAKAEALAAQLETGHRNVQVAERQVALARQGVGDTVIRAPFAGVVTTKDAQPGEMISPVSAGGGFTRTGICTVVDMKSLEIDVDVNEAYIDRVHPGQKVDATLDAYPDWKIPAHVITVVPAADRQKATVRVRIAFDQLDPRILPDMGIKVAFLGQEATATGTAQASVTVPKAAVHSAGKTSFVYLVKDYKIERRAVKVGSEKDDQVEVLAGLRGGEDLVVAASEKLEDGERVNVRPAKEGQ